MDPRHSAQDVVRCALCRDAVAPLYCNVCHTHLCGDCVAKHFIDKSKVHTVVPLQQFLSTLNYPKCPTHPTKQCELHCEQCDIPICSSCISSGKHIGHKAVDIFEDFERKKEVLRKDLEELEKSILPKYQESAANIKTQKTDQHKHSQKLTAELNKQGEALHREINTIIQRKQAEIDEMDRQHAAAIEKQEAVINKALHEIKQVIVHLKGLLETSDVGHVSKYKSRNGDFRKLPLKLKISLPNFQPQRIDTEQLPKQFGSLSSISIETVEQGYTLPSPGAESSPPARPQLDIPHLLTTGYVPRLVTDIPTSGYGKLYNVSCLSDEEIWIRGDNKIMKLYNLKGELLKSVQTKSENWPQDIAVTRSGGLVYTDTMDSSINLVSGTQIQTLITLLGWRPLSLCSTSSGDLLVIMDSDDYKQTKVVRYSGSTEKQTIQWDDQGNLLYSSNRFLNNKYLSENRNLDICVADNLAGAVVVVSAAGKLRFRYTGRDSTSRESFRPYGITTDSQANILTSDYNNHRIYIIDQDGHFLRFLHNCGLQEPRGLCVDSKDNLFVAEVNTGKVKKIMYYK
uniref:Tripartite motif-containing protein 3-like isoform X1 n=1 Tax=Crassostrea virginica TaxID=6565 RepID=A0A8B8BP89_CRAVI|nr:tripartite motif-containing protein 3-like isoform X1 [Crassostrea virginica]